MTESQKRFQEWMLSLNYSEIALSKYGHNQEGYKVGTYVDPLIAMAWLAWRESEKQIQTTNQQLVESREKLRDCDRVITLPDRMDELRDIAREAITNAKQQEKQ